MSDLPVIEKVLIRTSERTSPTQVDALQWVSASDRQVPPNAIMIGQEVDGRPLYFGRGSYENSLQPGKVGRHLCKGLAIAFSKREFDISSYYVLCGDASCLRWSFCQGSIIPPGLRPIIGGSDKNGETLYLAKCTFLGSDQIGKAGGHLRGMKFGFDGREFEMDSYFVLCVI